MKFLICFMFLAITFASSNAASRPVVGFLITSSGLGDQSFNDMTYSGLVRAKKELNMLLIREVTENSDVSRMSAVNKLVERNAEFIVASGWEFRPVIEKSAKLFPKVRFLLNDCPVTGHSNVVSTVFAQNEGAFLAGALAGWTSKTGRLGFVGGEDIPVVRAFQDGFKAGVLHADPNMDILSEFIAAPGSAPSGFSDPQAGYLVALDFYNRGADIIFSVAGLSGNGVIRAARRYGKFVIGVDADQDHMAKGLVLTSVMKRLDNATFTEVKRALEGDFVPGVRYYDLKQGGVGLSPMLYTRHLIPRSVLERISGLEKSIAEGTLKVPGNL